MRKYLDENSTINTIRLELRHPAGKDYLWVLVEGQTDQKLYTKLLNGSFTKIEIVHGGVESLRRALSTLIQETKQVLGIRDADFLHLDEQSESIDCLFLTDGHDAEMMMLSCNLVFESLVSEYLPGKQADFKELRQKLLSSLAFLGGLRWLNNCECLELNFKKISLTNFYNAVDLTLDKSSCVAEIEHRSPNKKRSVTLQEVEQKLLGITDYLNLCNGHDFVSAFALHVKQNLNKDVVASALRVAYRQEDFKITSLYQNLKNWEIRSGTILFHT